MIKTVFFDFDWTLFDHKTRSLVDSAVIAIRTIQNKGIKVIINSARTYYSLKGLNIFEKIKFDGYVVSNGGSSFIQNHKTGKDEHILYTYTLDKKILSEFIETAEKNKVNYLIKTRLNEYIKVFDKKKIDDFYSVYYETYPKDMKMFDINKEEAMVFQITDSEDKDFLFNPIGNKYKLYQNRFFYLANEFSSQEFLKETGIKAMIEFYNIKPDECAAFGDDVNDISMFNLVKYSVCMGNGNPLAKQHAKFITTNIENDGILNGLKHLDLLD